MCFFSVKTNLGCQLSAGILNSLQALKLLSLKVWSYNPAIHHWYSSGVKNRQIDYMTLDLSDIADFGIFK